MSANSYLFKHDTRGQMNGIVMSVLSMLVLIAFAVIIFFAIFDAGSDVIDENDSEAQTLFGKVKTMGITVIGLLIIVPLGAVAMVIMGIFYFKNRG